MWTVHTEPEARFERVETRALNSPVILRHGLSEASWRSSNANYRGNCETRPFRRGVVFLLPTRLPAGQALILTSKDNPMDQDQRQLVNARTRQDRRSEHRITTLYRPILIESDEFAGFCLLRNLSPEGMMGQFYTDFAVGTALRVQFHEEFSLTATVVWCRSGKIGLSFAEQIEVADVLMLLAKPMHKGWINRAPRLEIYASAYVRIDGRDVPVEVRDISQKGVKLRSRYLRPSDEVMLMLDGLEPRKAVVKWIQGEDVGLNFIRPLEFECLGNWAIWHQANHRGRSTSVAG